MISYTVTKGDGSTDRFLSNILRGDPFANLDALAQRGVEALRAATPVESGTTANSWYYEIEKSDGGVTIWWLNSHIVDGFPVAIGLQYGHGTGTGGWVQGYDYINEALRPIFDEIADKVWREVQNA